MHVAHDNLVNLLKMLFKNLTLALRELSHVALGYCVIRHRPWRVLSQAKWHVLCLSISGTIRWYWVSVSEWMSRFLFYYRQLLKTIHVHPCEGCKSSGLKREPQWAGYTRDAFAPPQSRMARLFDFHTYCRRVVLMLCRYPCVTECQIWYARDFPAPRAWDICSLRHF
jgi:hypothetical protein